MKSRIWLTDVRSIRREIDRLNGTIREFTEWKDRVTRARRMLLIGAADGESGLLQMLKSGTGWTGSIRYEPSNPAAAQLLQGWEGHGIESLESQLTFAIERRDALITTLPTAEETAAAESELSALRSTLSEKTAHLTAVWQRFLSTLESAAEVAHAVADAKGDTRKLAGEIHRVADTVGLDAGVAGLGPEVSTVEAVLAGALASLLQQCARQQSIEPQMEGAVRSAHAAVDRTRAVDSRPAA